MKKIINGKTYNTETAAKLGSDYSSVGPNDFHYWYESLHQTKKGTYFLYGEGGAMSHYAKPCGTGSWGGGDNMRVLTRSQAMAWAEEHLAAERYIELFGEIEG